MARYCFYIDGFNVYHALNDRFDYKCGMPRTEANKCFPYRKYKWLNYHQLAESVIHPKDTIKGIFYFTTLAGWKPDSVARHRVYIDALRTQGVETILGRFQREKVKCHLCQRYYPTHSEKRTDVNIAVRLLCDAIDDLYDKALVISADSDLLPVISAIHKYAPGKEIGVMFPIHRTSFELRQNADFRRKMSEKLLRNSQFPQEIQVGSVTLKRPDSWQ